MFLATFRRPLLLLPTVGSFLLLSAFAPVGAPGGASGGASAGYLVGGLAGDLAGELARDLAGELAGDQAGDLAGDPPLAGDPGADDGIECIPLSLRFEMEGWAVVQSCLVQRCWLLDEFGDRMRLGTIPVSWIEEVCDAPGSHEIPRVEDVRFPWSF
jgi:hypothetical protein